MNFGKEFKNYATKHHRINSLYLDKLVSRVTPIGMTPYIMEERQMNVT
ncbi:MAG: ATP-dependent Clp protease proteolytic subunit, partial [Flavobacterium sp.]|nr:ATP-dependent Clp protease proteolytic subunit [Flavobacterium sp.]